MPQLGAVAGVAVALVLALVACRSDEQPELPQAPAARVLEQALENPAARSGTTELDLELARSASEPIALSLDGPYELGGGSPRFDLALGASVAGFVVDGQLVSTGEDLYVVFFGENYRADPGSLAAATGLDPEPATWFERARYLGVEDVNGTDTARISAEVTTSLEREISELAARAGLDLEPSPGRGAAEAWVGLDDGLLHRVRLSLPLGTAQADPIGRLDLQADFSDQGESFDFQPPPGGGFQPLGELLDRLRGFGL